MGGMGINQKWSEISLGSCGGVWGVNQKWCEISLGSCGGVGINRKWSGFSLGVMWGGVGVNRKWSRISLGVMWGCGCQPKVVWNGGHVGVLGSAKSGLGLVWGSCGEVWVSTGSGLGLVWVSCGGVGVNRKWSGVGAGWVGVFSVKID